MTLRIIIIFLIFFFLGYKVFYYKEAFDSNILKTEIVIENDPTPYNYVIPSSTPSEYKGTTTNVVESENKQKITESRMNVYKAFMDTDCKNNFTTEILPTINRRVVLPLFLPALTLICSFLLIKNRKNIFLSNISIFAYSFILLLFAELTIRYTGINKLLNYSFILTPILLSILSYIILKIKFLNDN